MLLLETTQRHQSALANYCRSGAYRHIPGIHTKHVSQYRRLVLNIVTDILQSAYPLTHNLLSEGEWEALVLDFFTHHPCQAPQVWQMPEELHQYMTDVQHPLFKQYPFLEELLRLEWSETALFMMEDKPAAFTRSGDLLLDPLVLNPEHILLRFRYPVHLKQAKKIKAADEGDYHLILFREPDTGNVQFMDLSPALADLLQLLATGPANTKELVSTICAALGIAVNKSILEMVATFISSGLKSGLVLGFKKV